MRLGKTSISSKDKDLIRICYQLCNHSFKVKPDRTEAGVIAMRRSIYEALKKSPLFKYERGDYATFYITTKGFKCNKREAGYCPVINSYCEHCELEECAYYISRIHQLNDKESNAVATVGHIAVNSNWMQRWLNEKTC